MSIKKLAATEIPVPKNADEAKALLTMSQRAVSAVRSFSTTRHADIIKSGEASYSQGHLHSHLQAASEMLNAAKENIQSVQHAMATIDALDSSRVFGVVGFRNLQIDGEPYSINGEENPTKWISRIAESVSAYNSMKELSTMYRKLSIVVGTKTIVFDDVYPVSAEIAMGMVGEPAMLETALFRSKVAQILPPEILSNLRAKPAPMKMALSPFDFSGFARQLPSWSIEDVAFVISKDGSGFIKLRDEDLYPG